MASIVVNGDTSGAVTLSAPAVAGTVTVTLPSASGTMAVSGGSPSFAALTVTGDATIDGLTVGQGGGNVSFATALGYQAINGANTGSVLGVGYQAAYSNTSGEDNTAVGSYRTLYSNTTGNSNIAIGRQALQANTTASNNTAVGYQALYKNTVAGNTALGYAAGYQITTGTANTALGYYAMGSNGGGVTGGSNTAVGNVALTSISTGSYNVAIGDQSLYSNTGTGSCTAVGFQAGYALSGSAGNFVAIGFQCANNFTNGFSGTFIGTGVQSGAPTGNNEIVIGTNGQTGKGSSTGFIAPSTGGVYQGNNSSSWSTTSDQRLKKNIVDNTEGLDKIVQIRVRNFEYRTAEEVTELPAHSVIDKQGVQLGVIAQELQAVCSDCVKEESTGVLSVDASNLTWHMINAIKDLKAELDTVKAELAALKG